MVTSAKSPVSCSFRRLELALNDLQQPVFVGNGEVFVELEPDFGQSPVVDSFQPQKWRRDFDFDDVNQPEFCGV
jgi:hypothetical protein